MNRIGKTLFSVVCLLAGSVQAAEFSLPKYEKLTLENGLTVYLMEQHEVPLISAGVVVKAGAVQDDKAGQAEMTASALLLGSGTLNREAFQAKLDFVGASISSGSGLEGSVVNASFMAKDTDLVLGLLADALLKPTFSADEFNAYQQRQLAGLQQAQESPKAVINDYFNKLMFGDHPYGNEVSGSIASVKTMSLEDIKAFYNTWYQPNNAAISVVGDFDSKTMAASLRKLFGKWQGKTAAFDVPAVLSAPTKARVLLVNKGDARESTFMIGGPGISRSNPDYVALSVINTILGGRFTSWLNDELRVNAGLTYGARSGFSAYSKAGSFYISTFTQTATTEAAMDLALKTYSRLWEQGIDSATLESAKAYVKGQFPPRYERASSLRSLLADMFIYGFDERFINTFNEQVNALDTKKAAELVKQYFPKENLQFVVIGNAAEVKPVVSKYGQLIERDISAEQIKL